MLQPDRFVDLHQFQAPPPAIRAILEGMANVVADKAGWSLPRVKNMAPMPSDFDARRDGSGYVHQNITGSYVDSAIGVHFDLNHCAKRRHDFSNDIFRDAIA